jgi:hypothetical protein
VVDVNFDSRPGQIWLTSNRNGAVILVDENEAGENPTRRSSCTLAGKVGTCSTLDFSSDPNNCGGCGIVCAGNQVTGVCSNGKCSYVQGGGTLGVGGMAGSGGKPATGGTSGCGVFLGSGGVPSTGLSIGLGGTGGKVDSGGSDAGSQAGNGGTPGSGGCHSGACRLGREGHRGDARRAAGTA